MRRRALLALQILTIVRIPLAIAFAAVLLALGGSSPVILLGLSLLILAELTDLLDGIFARRFGIVTEWGAMLDPYADSIARLIVYWALACTGMVIALVPLVMAVRDVTVAYCRIVLKQAGRSGSAKFSGKVKAVVQCFGAMLAVLGPLYWNHTGTWTVLAISWIVIGVTLASMLDYAAAAARAARDWPEKGGENRG